MISASATKSTSLRVSSTANARLRFWRHRLTSDPYTPDPFYVFEQRYPYLVAIDSSHFARNQVNFVEKEHEEMRDFTQATEIADNVWVSSVHQSLMQAQSSPVVPYPNYSSETALMHLRSTSRESTKPMEDAHLPILRPPPSRRIRSHSLSALRPEIRLQCPLSASSGARSGTWTTSRTSASSKRTMQR